MMTTAKLRSVGLCTAALLSLGFLAGCDEAENQSTAVHDKPIERIDVSRVAQMEWPDPGLVANAMPAEDLFAQNTMIVLDMSGSMGERGCAGDHPDRATAAKEALLDWIGANPDARYGLVSFSGNGIQRDVPLGGGQDHAQALVDRISSVAPGGGTPLRSAMQMAAAELEAQAARQSGLGAYRIVVITDGAASNGQSPGKLVNDIAANPANGIEIHTIGFCISGRHVLNDPSAVFYVDANSPEDLSKGLQATQGEADSFTATDTTFEEING